MYVELNENYKTVQTASLLATHCNRVVVLQCSLTV